VAHRRELGGAPSHGGALAAGTCRSSGAPTADLARRSRWMYQLATEKIYRVGRETSEPAVATAGRNRLFCSLKPSSIKLRPNQVCHRPARGSGHASPTEAANYPALS
jgi:hypothetical protein